MKKVTFPILCALLIASLLLTPVFAFGYTKTGEGRAALLQEGNYSVSQKRQSGEKSRAAGTKSGVSAKDFVYSELLALNTSINLTSYGISINDIGDFYGDVINSNPDLFFVSSGFGYNYYPSTGNVAYLSPQYTMTAAEVTAAMAEFNAGAAKALAEVDGSMSDLQKALTLHDYICSTATYPVLETNSQGQVTNDEHDWHTALGFFRDEIAVCAGYSLAYEYLLNQLGIPCVYVGSDPMTHAWNKVQLDGSWYNVDITFDNHDNAQGQNTVGSMRHAHFLKSDSYFASESGSCHYGGTTYEVCAADSTAYDGAFWDDLPCSRIYAVNGDYYYLKPNNGRYGILYLTKRSPDGTETKLGTYFTTSYLNYTGYAFDENGVQHNIPYTDSLARLALLDNRFYVVSKNTVYSKLFDGTQFTIASTDGSYVNGFGVNGDGNLIWQPYTDSTVINELDKEAYYNGHLTVSKTNGSADNYNNYPDINLDGVINAKDYAYIIRR